MTACVWAKFNNNTRENYFSFSIITPSCTCRYKVCNQLYQLSQRCGKVNTLWVTNFSKEHLPEHCTLIQTWFMDCSMPYRVWVRNLIFLSFLAKHLFDKRSVQPAALQLETSNMERENFDLGQQWNGKHSQWHLHQRWCNGVARATEIHYTNYHIVTNIVLYICIYRKRGKERDNISWPLWTLSCDKNDKACWNP